MALAELVVSIIGDTAKLKQAFAEVDKQVTGMGKSMQAMGKQMSSVGKDLSMKVTAPIVGLGALSLNTAVKFDDAMRQVQAVSGATGQQFEELREVAKDLGATTRYSATEAADGMNYLAMAGFETNEIVETMPGLLDLAAASGTDLGTAADITSNILTGFNMQASEAGHLSDVLAKASASANTDVAQLGEAMSYAAPVASSFNMSVEEATAAVGMFSNAGIQASMAGTTLRGIMTRLSTPTGQAASALEKYGLTMDDVNPATHDLSEIVATLADVGLSSADAMTIFGQRAGPGMLALISQGSEGMVDLTTQLENADGAAQKMADTMEGGAGGAMRELRSVLESLMNEFGDIIAEIILPFIEGLKSLVRCFADLPGPVKRVIVIVAGLAAAVGPLFIIFGTLISSVGSIMTLLGGAGLTATLGGLAATLGPIIAVAAAFAALGYLIYKNWDRIYPALEPVIQQLKELGSEVMEKVSTWWDSNGETIINGLQTLADVLGDFVAGIISLNASGIAAIFPVIATVITETLDIILSSITLFLSILTGDWETAWDALGEITDSSLNVIIKLITSVTAPLHQAFAALWSGLSGAVTDAWGGVTDALYDIFNGIIRSINNLASQMYRAGRNVMDNLVSGIKSRVRGAVATVRDAASRIRNYFPFSPAKEGPLKDIPNWDAHLVDPIKTSMAKAESTINGGMQGVSTAVNNTTNTTNIGGDTFTIQNVTLSQDYNFDKFMADMARYNAQKRVQRGI